MPCFCGAFDFCNHWIYYYFYNMKVKEIVKRLEAEGWVEVRQKGSHRIFKKQGTPDLIVLPDHGANKEPSIGVLKDIMKKAGWDQF